jgi:preprotein translocase subunit SecD
MNTRIRARLIVVVLLTIVAVYFFAGLPPRKATLKEKIHLGLDLQGGLHLILQVKTDDAVRSETDQAVEQLRASMRGHDLRFRETSRIGIDTIVVSGIDSTQELQFQKLLTEEMRDWEQKVSQQANAYTLKLNARRATQIRNQAGDQTIIVIRKRLDQLGVAELGIQRYGPAEANQILLQLPGFDNSGRVKELVQTTALLELKLVDRGPFVSQSAAVAEYAGQIPVGLDVVRSREMKGDSALYYVLRRESSITGRDLKTAFTSRDENGHPAVGFNLTAEGSRRFSRVTEQNIGKRLAIVLDGTVQSAPEIFSRITDAGIIRGGPIGFTPTEANDLALVLRSGALPASIQYLEESVVGPTLGADSVRAGVTAAVIALVSVSTFMTVYYRMSGVNAVVAMLLNVVLLLGAIAYFGITLTLPGIAGITLTIGVGIDSNVLIFERIREELRTGKTAIAAVQAGFSRVFVTLIDTHLAAVISAAFLFLFGTGPIKGFAVALVIGLASNLFTSVFVSRTLFELVLQRRRNSTSISI